MSKKEKRYFDFDNPYDSKFAHKVNVIKTYLQFLIGFILIGILAFKGLFEVLQTVELLAPNKICSIVQHFLDIHTFSYIANALAISAGLELGYMLFTNGPDEAIEPLMLGVTSAAFYTLSANSGGSWVLGVYALSILVLMYCIKKYNDWELGKKEQTINRPSSKYSIKIEDESDGTFIKLQSVISVVTNIDKEHLEFYGSFKELKKSFQKFISHIPFYGFAVVCLDDKNNKEIIKKIKIKNYYTYGVDKNSQFQIKNIYQSRDFSKFNLDIRLPGKKQTYIKNIKIPLLGLHNVRNATAAAAVAITIGISKDIIKQGLKEFKGVQRRFNKIFKYRETEFYDDYAHHPTEIKEVLNGVKEAYKKEEIICIFQPHRISRLKDLRKEFSLSFKKANSVILCPVYSAGEKLKLGFNYFNYAKEIMKNSKVNVFMVKDQYELAKFIKQNIYGKKIVIGMGAGSISNWIRELPNLIL